MGVMMARRRMASKRRLMETTEIPAQKAQEEAQEEKPVSPQEEALASNPEPKESAELPVEDQPEEAQVADKGKGQKRGGRKR